MFDDIGVELDKTCWYTIKVLIYEIVFNAKEHGKAQKCFVQITKNSIAVFDDGTEFDPQEMKQREECHGGAMALQDVMENYPEIVLKSTYANGLNRFEMIFPKGVFYLLAGRKSKERMICSENCAILNLQRPGADVPGRRYCFSLQGASGNREKHIHYKKFTFGNEVIKNGKVFWNRWLPWGSGH